MTNVEYHECIPMHNNDNKCKSDYEWRHIDVKEYAKGSVNECMEHPLDRFSNTPDIDTVDIKGQTAVTEGLYQTHTEPYFQLSSTRDTKVSNNLKIIYTYCYSIKICFSFLNIYHVSKKLNFGY